MILNQQTSCKTQNDISFHNWWICMFWYQIYHLKQQRSSSCYPHRHSSDWISVGLFTSPECKPVIIIRLWLAMISRPSLITCFNTQWTACLNTYLSIMRALGLTSDSSEELTWGLVKPMIILLIANTSVRFSSITCNINHITCTECYKDNENLST